MITDSLSPVYVIGHLNPDTDAIAAAMGYAWLLRERDGTERWRVFDRSPQARAAPPPRS